MNNVSKSLALTLILVVATSSLSIIVNPASAQVVTKPSIPEFIAKYVDYSYDIPPTYGTDEYTGKTVVTKQGEHIDNRTVEITITNQPFTPYNDSNGNMINRFYDVRYKGSYTENWTTMFRNQTQLSGIGYANPYMTFGYAVQDYSSQYTAVIYQLTWQIPTNGQMDFQVEALEGYTRETSYDGHIFFAYAGFTFYGQESGWSNTQTIKLGENEVSTTTPIPTPTITSTPNSTLNNPTTTPSPNGNQQQIGESAGISIPLTTFLLVVVVFVAIIAGLFLVLYRRTRKTPKQQTA